MKASRVCEEPGSNHYAEMLMQAASLISAGRRPFVVVPSGGSIVAYRAGDTCRLKPVLRVLPVNVENVFLVLGGGRLDRLRAGWEFRLDGATAAVAKGSGVVRSDVAGPAGQRGGQI